MSDDEKQKFIGAQARAVAEAVCFALKPSCERIEIAGSLRRNKPWVKDIEIVCVPRVGTDLFGEPTKECFLTRGVAQLMQERRLFWRGAKSGDKPIPPKGTERYMSLMAARASIPVDLFVVRPPAQWGAIFAIRTGPADFSKKLVTTCRYDGLHCEDGRLLNQKGETVPTPEEVDFFQACGMAWIEPERRA